MLKKLLIGIATAYGIYGANAMDPELQEWKEWTPIVGEMPFPKMAIDGTDEHPEPEELSDFHKSRKRLWFRCFMPKNQEEMDLLYNAYKADVFKPDWKYGDSREQKGWSHVLIDIGEGLSIRYRSGDMYFVDKFLDHLDIFVGMAVAHPDKDFIGTQLFDPDVCGLRGKLYETRHHFGGSYAISKDWSNVIHVLERIDAILQKTGSIGDYSMLKSAFHFDAMLLLNREPDRHQQLVDLRNAYYVSDGLK